MLVVGNGAEIKPGLDDLNMGAGAADRHHDSAAGLETKAERSATETKQ